MKLGHQDTDACKIPIKYKMHQRLCFEIENLTMHSVIHVLKSRCIRSSKGYGYKLFLLQRSNIELAEEHGSLISKHYFGFILLLLIVVANLRVTIYLFLLQQWNDTYLHYDKVNPKQTYYLSMEYLQGRTLTNAVGNLDIHNAYADALKKLGHELEEVVEQVVKP